MKDCQYQKVDELTLRGELLNKGVPKEHLGNYCSDLQVLKTTQTEKLLKELLHPVDANNKIIVKGDVVGSDWFGKLFYEIPFAFTEHYNKKE